MSSSSGSRTQGPLRRSRSRLTGLAVALGLSVVLSLLSPARRDAAVLPGVAAVAAAPGARLAAAAAVEGEQAMDRPELSSGRRDTLAGAVAASLAGLVPPLTLSSSPAHAEQPWQLKLPRSWKLFSQTPMPPKGVVQSVALIVAGNPVEGGELVVLRVPLSIAAGDPNAEDSKKLIEYFSTPDGKGSSVKGAQVVDVVAKSQKSSPGLQKFALAGSPVESVKGGRRYVRYEYESSICQGQVKFASSGDTCVAPEDDSPLPLFERRHAITLTVTSEDTNGQTNYLWLLDVSAPSDKWKDLTEPIQEVSGSFELGTEDQLEKDRTVELTKEQLDALKELEKAGKLPKDEVI